MRPAIVSAARVSSALGEATSSRVFVCRDCLARGAAAGIQGQRRSYAEQKKRGGVFDSETWRRKIWGTDNPPGPKDPYTQSQFLPERNDQLAESDQPGEVEEVKTYEGSSLEEAKAFDPEYEPADTWQGLSRIGGATGWWEKVWDEDNQFQRWSHNTVQNMHPRLAANYIHRAFVEVRVLEQAGLDINDVSFIPKEMTMNYNQITLSQEGGEVTLQFPNETWEQEIIDSISAGEGELVEETVDAVTPTEAEAKAVAEDLAEPVLDEASATEADAAPKTSESSVATPEPANIDLSESTAWRHIKIGDDKTKFALSKRVMQLTGTRIPDTAIAKATELGLLMQLGFRWKAPKQLAKELITEPKDFKHNNQSWYIAPNVTVHTRRDTYVSQEKRVGRWKKIQKELRERNLPMPRRSKGAY